MKAYIFSPLNIRIDTIPLSDDSLTTLSLSRYLLLNPSVLDSCEKYCYIEAGDVVLTILSINPLVIETGKVLPPETGLNPQEGKNIFELINNETERFKLIETEHELKKDIDIQKNHRRHALILILPLLAAFNCFWVGLLFSNTVSASVFLAGICANGITLLYFALAPAYRKKVGGMKVCLKAIRQRIADVDVKIAEFKQSTIISEFVRRDLHKEKIQEIESEIIALKKNQEEAGKELSVRRVRRWKKILFYFLFIFIWPLFLAKYNIFNLNLFNKILGYDGMFFSAFCYFLPTVIIWIYPSRVGMKKIEINWIKHKIIRLQHQVGHAQEPKQGINNL